MAFDSLLPALLVSLDWLQTAIIFLIALVVLIVVHELGHFFAAKWAGMKVEEFGIGYPPRAKTFAKKDGTEYTLNWLPFGGFVKIKGEDETASGVVASDSFAAKSHLVQALVLVAGIFMNLVFAWVLLSFTLAIGMPRALTPEEAVLAGDATLVISRVVEGSPADAAGLMRGDIVTGATAGETSFEGFDPEVFASFVAHAHEPVVFSVERGNEALTIAAEPQAGILSNDPDRKALGVGVTPVGTRSVSWWQAPIEGVALTYAATKEVAAGLASFFGGVFTLRADLSQVSGPLGIAGAVGDASDTSIIALLTLTALISINLALINIIPIPALDGGRLLFVLIEAVTRRPIPSGLAGAMNGIGFLFLILLMVVVTASDIWKAFA